MGLFHHESREQPAGGDEASFEVLSGDGRIMRYDRDDFAEVFETTDDDEVRQQLARGWVILDQRSVPGPDQGPSSLDTLPEIEALRAGGLFAHETNEELTAYTLGYLKDGAVGTPVE